jgi:uncharacterized surface protein with fasciclin (FAS1) repeats
MSSRELSWFGKLIQLTGYKSALNEDGELTVLAPIDEALMEFDQQYLEQLQSPDYGMHLRDIIEFHISRGGLVSCFDNSRRCHHPWIHLCQRRRVSSRNN